MKKLRRLLNKLVCHYKGHIPNPTPPFLGLWGVRCIRCGQIIEGTQWSGIVLPKYEELKDGDPIHIPRIKPVTTEEIAGGK